MGAPQPVQLDAVLERAQHPVGLAEDRAGVDAEDLRRQDSERTVACWAMGLTQHKHAVAMIAALEADWGTNTP